MVLVVTDVRLTCYPQSLLHNINHVTWFWPWLPYVLSYDNMTEIHGEAEVPKTTI